MPKIFRLFIITSMMVFSSGLSLAADRYIDDGQEVFFSDELGTRLNEYKDFPMTWWNFLVWDLPDTPNAETWAKLGNLCQNLQEQYGSLLIRFECRQDVARYQEVLQDWSRDYPLRHALANEAEIKRALRKTLTKASLPTSATLLSLFRQDPFESYQELNQLISKKVGINLERTEGYFYDAGANRLVVPVQFKFPPDQDPLTKEFLDGFSAACQTQGLCTRWALLGPHGSTVENKDQILGDVGRVSTVGLIVLAILSLVLLKIKRARLLLLFPAVLAAFVITVVVTIAGYSSIHGLTMAFGIGNIGLSLDYGFHSAFNVGKKKIWKANFFGLLTTGVVLGVLAFSKIPLFQQLMLFSLCGLAIAFGIFWLMFRFKPEWFQVEPLPVQPAPSRRKAVFVIAIFIGGLVASMAHSLTLDMSAMDYQSKEQKLFRKWISEKIDKKNPLIEIYATPSDQAALSLSHERLKWARANRVSVENAALYLPELKDQQEQVSTWRGMLCNDKGEDKPTSLNLSAVEEKFFAPFFERVNCPSLKALKLNVEKPPAYVKDFFSHGKEINLWFPKNEAEVNKIIQRFPNATSLKDVANVFPNTLLRELMWMIPLSLSLILLILWYYYRSFSVTLISIIPFLTAVGLVSGAHFLIKTEFSFVGLIALLMVCGISVDYGIFATDACRKGQTNDQNGVWSALLFAAISTITGFIPLIFSKHPVLLQLGQTLSLGVAGTVLGTFWGIPYFMNKFYKERVEI